MSNLSGLSIIILVILVLHLVPRIMCFSLKNVYDSSKNSNRDKDTAVMNQTNLDFSSSGGMSIWNTITIPKISYFANMGFPTPTDVTIWGKAQINAMSGKPVLLEQVMKTIRSPTELLSGDIKFRRIKKLVDHYLCDDTGFRPLGSYNYRGR